MKMYGKDGTLLIADCDDMIRRRIKAVNDAMGILVELAVSTMSAEEIRQLMPEVEQFTGEDEAACDGNCECAEPCGECPVAGAEPLVLKRYEGTPFAKVSEVLKRLPHGQVAEQRRDDYEECVGGLDEVLHGRHDIRNTEDELRALVATLDDHPEFPEQIDRALELVKALALSHEIVD